MAKQPDQSWRAWVLGSLPKMTMTQTAGFEPGPANPQPLSFGASHIAPQLDLIELLPPAAADKLRMLPQRADDAHAVTVPFTDIQEATALKQEAERALKRLTDHSQDGGFNLPPTDPRVVVAEKHLDKMAADLKRLQERSEARSQAWQTASQAKAAVEAWLRDGKPHGTVLQDHETEPPKLLKGETVIDAIERLRRRGRELKADLHRIASAPYPSSRAKRKMREQIEQLAQRAPDTSMLIEHDRDIAWQTQRVTSEVHAERRSLAFTEVPDAVALVAWLHKDALIKRLDAEIDAEADDKLP